MESATEFSRNNHSEGTTYVPRRGVFECTLACNLQCKHCGSSAGKARSDELTTAECAGLFRELKALGMEWLTISGGEPTLRSDWQTLIRQCAGEGIQAGMITNAVSLCRDDIREAQNNGLTSFGFSVDGMERTHDGIRGRKGHFQLLMNAMAYCRQLDMPFCVITTLCNHNALELEAIHQLVAGHGAYAWQVQPGVQMGNMRHHPDMALSAKMLPRIEQKLSELMVVHPLKILPGDSLGYFGLNEKQIRQHCGGSFGGCRAGISNIGIECNGNVKGCLSIMAGYNETDEHLVEGNIRETPLAEIWHREDAFAATRQWHRSQLSGFCASCQHVKRCKGGCLGKRIASGIPGETELCTYRVLVENSCSPGRVMKAASIFFAAGLTGTAVTSCETTPIYSAPYYSETDDDTETSISEDTGAEAPTDDGTSDNTAEGTAALEDTDTAEEVATDTTADTDESTDSDTDEWETDTGNSDTDTDTDTTGDYEVPLYAILYPDCLDGDTASGEVACFDWATVGGPCTRKFDACMEDDRCRAIADCINADGTKEGWQARKEACFIAAGDEAVQKYWAYQQCVFCDACDISCMEYAESRECDDYSGKKK